MGRSLLLKLWKQLEESGRVSSSLKKKYWWCHSDVITLEHCYNFDHPVFNLSSCDSLCLWTSAFYVGFLLLIISISDAPFIVMHGKWLFILLFFFVHSWKTLMLLLVYYMGLCYICSHSKFIQFAFYLLFPLCVINRNVLNLYG